MEQLVPVAVLAAGIAVLGGMSRSPQNGPTNHQFSQGQDQQYWGYRPTANDQRPLEPIDFGWNNAVIRKHRGCRCRGFSHGTVISQEDHRLTTARKPRVV